MKGYRFSVLVACSSVPSVVIPATLPNSRVLDWPMMMKTLTGLVMSAGKPSGSGSCCALVIIFVESTRLVRRQDVFFIFLIFIILIYCM